MPFVFYDVETTGLDRHFDQILQLAAIHTDDELVALDRLSLRCRRLPYVVPAPAALLATRLGRMELEQADASHYELMCRTADWLARRAPAVMVGYNSMRFDEAVLRQGFYQSLLPVAVTTSGGNGRADLLQIARAVSVYAPGVLAIPTRPEDGRPSFALGALARANGVAFDEATAHDALADVEATLAFARLLRAGAPTVWSVMIEHARKSRLAQRLQRDAVLCFTWFKDGRPTTRAVTQVAQVGSEVVLFDLGFEPEESLGGDLGSLLGAPDADPPCPLVVIRLTAYPLVFPAASAPDGLIDLATATARARVVREREGLAAAVTEALTRRVRQERALPWVESRIGQGLPGQADERLMHRLHRVPWPERAALAAELADERYVELAYRLLFCERPDVLAPPDRDRLAAWVRDRLFTEDDVPWMTVPKARRALAELRALPDADPARLDEIEALLPALQ